MAIQQGTVTITGFVGSMPVPFGRSGGVEGCSFRMGSTRRYRDGGTGEWRNLPTTWITVKAFRTLASNARMSLHVGGGGDRDRRAQHGGMDDPER